MKNRIRQTPLKRYAIAGVFILSCLNAVPGIAGGSSTEGCKSSPIISNMSGLLTYFIQTRGSLSTEDQKRFICYQNKRYFFQWETNTLPIDAKGNLNSGWKTEEQMSDFLPRRLTDMDGKMIDGVFLPKTVADLKVCDQSGKPDWDAWNKQFIGVKNKNYIGWINAYVDQQFAAYKTKYPNAIDDEITKRAAKKAFPLPCRPPTLDFENGYSIYNPVNVNQVMLILKEEDWNKYVPPNKAGSAAGSGPKPYTQPDWKTFLTVVARYPYFCGEKSEAYGLDEKETCKRELASLLAHAAQETGAHTGDGNNIAERVEQRLSSLLNFARESTLYGTPCPPQYSARTQEAIALGAKKNVCFYGRGIKQTTHFYNYMTASAAFTGNYKTFFIDPDQIAQFGYYLLSSGVQFAMTAEPPKPSIHDVLIGAYRPENAAAGITLNAKGAVTDPFKATVSIVNGGFNCGNGDTKPTTEGDNHLAGSKTRFLAYKILLTNFEANLSPVETDYNAETFCDLDKGAIFANKNLYEKNGGRPSLYVDLKTCQNQAAGGLAQPLNLAGSISNIIDICAQEQQQQ
jgi:basic endochitinase B